MKSFFCGIIFMLAALIAGVYIAVTHGWIPANADGAPGVFETWAAHKSLGAALKGVTDEPVTMAATSANLIAGIKIYRTNCAFCHGASDGKASNVATGLFQHAPQFASDLLTDHPENRIHWFVTHGVRFTGMPSFTNSLSEGQIWQVVLFLKHMAHLPPAAQKVWKSVPSSKFL
jgi:mono/diheme cytochrome c family protein